MERTQGAGGTGPYLYRNRSFGAPIVKAVKKEAKHYHFDWTVIEEDGIRFENLIASHLLKWVHFQQDMKGLTMSFDISGMLIGGKLIL